MAAPCPIRSSRFPDNGRSAKPGVFELKFSEADVGDITQSADAVEKLANWRKERLCEKIDVHNRSIFDDLTSGKVLTYLGKMPF